MPQPTLPDPIDAVITWVDGNAPAHRAKRARYMAQAGKPLHENARNPHRWESSDEIYFCLASIHNHAPWVRTIWILVERDGPDLSHLPQSLRGKIRICTHDQVFDGLEHAALPTFNSLAIESVMWRIDGLSERFLYFNDDVFLTAPLRPEDSFMDDHPVLRGAWADYTALAQDAGAQDDPALFNHFMQLNAAHLSGTPVSRIFEAAHVVHPLRRDVLAYLFGQHRAAFDNNVSHRFRDLSQFLPQALHNQYCISKGQVALADTPDSLHITSGQGGDGTAQAVRGLLLPEALVGVKFLCVNDLPQLEQIIPDARALIAQAVGGALV